MARDHAVAEHLVLIDPEIDRAVHHEAADFDETTDRVEQQIDAFARRELAGFVLFLDAILAAAESCLLIHGVEASRFAAEAGVFRWRDMAT